MISALGLLATLTPQAPAAATSHVSITGTGTNEVVTEFHMTPLSSSSTCFENNFDYASVVSVAHMNVNGTNYTVEFDDTGTGKQSFGNLGGSYDSESDCNSSTNPGRGGDIHTDFAPTGDRTNTVSLFETGSAIAVDAIDSDPVPASCTFDTFNLDPSSDDYGTFSVLGPAAIQAHLDGECTIGGQTDTDVHLLVNVEVLAMEPDPADPDHFTVYQTSCFTYKDSHTANPPGGCDANG